MKGNRGQTEGGAKERILAAATSLIAQRGYKSVSVREIATAACVNEITVFRHYPHKHDLHLAVMESGLQQLILRGDLLTGIAESSNGKTALERTFELIAKTVMENPEVLRVLQFGVLEFSADFEPLLRKHLSEFVEVVASYLEPWIKKGDLRCANSKAMVFTMIAIVTSYSSIQRLFLPDAPDSDGMFSAYMSFVALENS